MSSQQNHHYTSHTCPPLDGTPPLQTRPSPEIRPLQQTRPPPHTRPRRRHSKAIPIVNPNPPPPPPPPAPPAPSTASTTTKLRINPGYLHLKKIIEQFDKTALPASAGDPHFYALPGNDIASKDINSEQHEPGVIRADPLHHVLNFVFLPYRCDTTTCRERFQVFHNSITQDERERMATWKHKIETNFNHMRDTTNNLGSDAAVSRAMKMWVEGIVGISIDATYSMKYMEKLAHGPTQRYSLDPPLNYRENNMRMPVYYSSPQYYSGHPPAHAGYDPGFTNTGSMGGIYNPPRIPQQSVHIPRPIPNIRLQPHPSLRPANVFASQPTSVPPHVTPGFEWENSTNISRGRKLGSKHLWEGPPVSRLNVASQGHHQNRIPQYIPIPNPSGRKTPPHQRSPKLKNNTASVSKLGSNKKVTAVAPKWIEGSKAEAANTAIKKRSDEKDHVLENQEWNSSYCQSTTGLSKVNSMIIGLKEAAAQSAVPTVPLTGLLIADEGDMDNSTRFSGVETGQMKQRAFLKEHYTAPTNENGFKTGRQSALDSNNMEQRNYAKAVSGANQNENQQHSVTLPTSTNSNKGQINDPAMLASQKSSDPGLRTAKRLHVSLNYAKAASGVDGRNEEPKEVFRVPVPHLIPSESSPVIKKPWSNASSWRNNNPRAEFEYTPGFVSPETAPAFLSGHSGAVFPNERVEDAEFSVAAKCQLPANLGSLSSKKSWSSIVTGRIDDTSPRYQRGPINIETLEYPELGSRLGTHQSSQSRTYFSAQAKTFEPTGPRRNPPTDPYRSTTGTPNPSQFSTHKPLTRANPSLIPPDNTNIYYPDPLLEVFFNTPQLIEYYGKSYDNLLFHQNCLRVQFQRIETVFQDEWDMITPWQRKAIVSRAISNLDEKLDKVQFWDIPNVEKMLSDLGLGDPTFSNRYNNRGEYARISYLRSRADYCFDLDPDAFANSSYWLFNMIGLLLGTQIPQKYRENTSPRQTDDSPLISPDSSYTGDSPQSVGSEETMVERKDPPDEPEPPMLECFLHAINYTTRSENYEPNVDKETKKLILEQPRPNSAKQSYKRHSANRAEGLIPPHINFTSAPRLMSNRFQDSVFKCRPQGWVAANPGRARFMKIVEIDITLFYCEFIEEILRIFGEVRRERVWYTLPTIWDFFNGPASFPPQSRSQLREERLKAKNSYRSARPRERSMSCPTWGCKELGQLNRYNRWIQSPGKLAEAKRAVDRERLRVHNFVKETQRTADWAVAGLKLVERETDSEIGRAWDGGLWSIPMPVEEKQALQAGFTQWHIWRG